MNYQCTAKELSGKTDRSRNRSVHGTELHKEFYCDNNNFANLEEIDYNGHLTQIDDDEHLTSAGCLLRGSCQAFAMTVEGILGYKAFVIEERERYRFHAFSQNYLNGKRLTLMPEGNHKLRRIHGSSWGVRKRTFCHKAYK